LVSQLPPIHAPGEPDVGKQQGHVRLRFEHGERLRAVAGLEQPVPNAVPDQLRERMSLSISLLPDRNLEALTACMLFSAIDQLILKYLIPSKA
jgi:hypothetical protein